MKSEGSNNEIKRSHKRYKVNKNELLIAIIFIFLASIIYINNRSSPNSIFVLLIVLAVGIYLILRSIKIGED